MEIDGPRGSGEFADRFLECEEALEAAFQDLVGAAIMTGWGEGEVCAALCSLADHHLLAMECNRQTKQRVSRSRDD